MSFIAKEMRAERFKLVNDAQALISSGKVTAETMAQFNAMMSESDALKANIDTVENALRAAADVNTIIGISAESRKMSVSQVESDLKKFENFFVANMRAKAELPLSREDRAMIEDYRNAASVGTNSAGGYTVETDLTNQIISALILQGGVRQAVGPAGILQTSSGNPLVYVNNDDTAQTATIVAEGADVGNATDMTFGITTLTAYNYTTSDLQISKNLLQDSSFNFQTTVTDALTQRFARGTNAHYTTGSGTSQPQGVVTAASSGLTTASNSAVTYADLVNLEFSVAQPYRAGAKMMCSDSGFKAVRQIVDTTGRPIFSTGIAGGAPDTILGYPVVINANMAAMGPSNKPILFGNFSSYVIRDVADISFQILVEKYARLNQIAVIGSMRTDARQVSTGAMLRYITLAA